VSIVLVDIVRKDRFNDGTLSDAVELGRQLDALAPATETPCEDEVLPSR
jgi:hypothetical protein